jgi:outer membrane protein TolC
MISALLLSKHSRIILTTALLLAATPARAQRVLTLDEALAIARQNNRDLAQARARVEQASAGVSTAYASLLPTLAAQGKYTHNYKEVTLNEGLFSTPTTTLAQVIGGVAADQALRNALVGKGGFVDQAAAATAMLPNGGNVIIQKEEQLDFALNLAVPLLVPWAYPALHSAKQTVGASRSNYDATIATVLLATAQAYYACAGTDELVAARQHAVTVARSALETAKARLDAGVVNRVEVTRAELQLVRQEQALVETLDTQASAYRSLGTIMNMHEPVRVAPAEMPASRDEPIDQLTAEALKLRPEFRALEQTIGASSSTVNSNLWRWAPTLSGFGFVRAFNYPGFSGDQYAWALGLQLDWTLYDGGIRDAQRKLAAAQRRESQARLELLRDSVADDIYNSARSLKTKRRAVETAQRSLQLSKETLDLVTVQHDAGTATQLDLLQAQDSLVGAEVALAQAHFDLALGALALERNAGTFPGNRNLR